MNSDDKTLQSARPQTSSPTHNKNASDAALEYVKQLLTLASAVLVVSAIFVSRVSAKGIAGELAILAAWFFLLISLICGIVFITAVVASRINDDDKWAESTPKRFSRASFRSFSVAIAFFVFFAFQAYSIRNQSGSEQDNERGVVRISIVDGTAWSTFSDTVIVKIPCEVTAVGIPVVQGSANSPACEDSAKEPSSDNQSGADEAGAQ